MPPILYVSLIRYLGIYMFQPLGAEDEATLKKMVDALEAEKAALALVTNAQCVQLIDLCGHRN